MMFIQDILVEIWSHPTLLGLSIDASTLFPRENNNAQTVGVCQLRLPPD